MSSDLSKISSESKITFAVSDGKIEIPYNTFIKFKTLSAMCEDLGMSAD